MDPAPGGAKFSAGLSKAGHSEPPSDAAMDASGAAGVELTKRNVLQAQSGGNAGGPNDLEDR